MANLVSFSYIPKFFTNIVLAGTLSKNPLVGELAYDGTSEAGALKYGNALGLWVELATVNSVHSIPSGGTRGQALVKTSNDDYAVGWQAISGGGNVPAGGTANQVLAKNSATDYDLKWVDQTGGQSTMHAAAAIISASDIPQAGGDVSVFTDDSRPIGYLLLSGDPAATFTIQCWELTKNEGGKLISPDITVIEDTSAGTTSLNVSFANRPSGDVKLNLFWSASGTVNGTTHNGITYDQNVVVQERVS